MDFLLIIKQTVFILSGYNICGGDFKMNGKPGEKNNGKITNQAKNSKAEQAVRAYLSCGGSDPLGMYTGNIPITAAVHGGKVYVKIENIDNPGPTQDADDL